MMRDLIVVYKPYMMYSVQQLYNDGMNLSVEMLEHLMSILEDRRNDG